MTASLVQLTRRSPRAARYFLSTRYPERWGPKATHALAEFHPGPESIETQAGGSVEPSPRLNDPGVIRIDQASLSPSLRASIESTLDGTADPRVVHSFGETDWRRVDPSLREEAE